MDFSRTTSCEGSKGVEISPLELFGCLPWNRPYLQIHYTFKTTKEIPTMALKKSIWIVFGFLVVSALVVGSEIKQWLRLRQ